MIIVVSPNSGFRLAEISSALGTQDPSRTCSMLGFGEPGLTKNHIEAAKLSHVVATGFSRRTIGSPNIALEKAP